MKRRWLLFSFQAKKGTLAFVAGGCAAVFGCQSNCGKLLLEALKDHVYQATVYAYSGSERNVMQ